MANSVFRFAVVRPPRRTDPEALDERTVLSHRPDAEPTSLVRELTSLREAGDREAMRSLARDFMESTAGRGASFLRDLDELDAPIAAIDRWLLRHDDAPELESFIEFLKELGISGAPDGYSGDRDRVGDSIVARLIVSDAPSPAPHLARAMRIIGLLERLEADRDALAGPGAIRRALRAGVLLPAQLYPLPRVESAEKKRILEEHRTRSKAAGESLARLREINGRLDELGGAIDEVGRAYDVERTALQASVLTLAKDAPAGPSPAGDPRRGPAADEEPVSLAPIGQSRAFLSESGVRGLSEDTRRVLTDLGIDPGQVHVPTVIDSLERESAEVARAAFLAAPRTDVVPIGNAFVPARDFFEGTGGAVFDPPRFPVPGPCPPAGPESPTSPGESLPLGPGAVESVGVGDLMVVEQELQRYEAGEIAHIENVLAGETKERTHRRARTTEEEVVLETETTEDTERDLESTDRFELQTEVQEVVKEDSSLEAGLTVSGKYGWVDFKADTRYARETAREESRRTSTGYSRDVTERAVSRIQERVLSRRARRTVEEFEETNLHRLEGGPEHVVGVYRWVDKLYRAQLINYGRRAMFEFVVPQPAAFLKHAMSGRPREGRHVEKPDRPGYCQTDGSTFKALRASDITPTNYTYWTANYGAVGVQPPPARFKIVAAAFADQIPSGDATAQADVTVKTPAGYLAKRAWLRGTPGFLGSGPGRVFRVYVGRHDASNFNFEVPLDGEDDVVPVAIVVSKVAAYGFTLEVECERSKTALEEWQLATFEAIMTAYRDQEAEYREGLAALQVREGVSIQGRNPLANRELEKTELKRAAISILTDQHFDLFDALRKGVPRNGYPQLDLAEAAIEGPYIRFFEQAFEWENMTYVLYPYYWGRKEDWIFDALLDDTDPLFAQFLRAGAARLVVPARPGFEAAVCSYLLHGWPIPDEADAACVDNLEGEGLPLLSIVDEVKAQQGYSAVPGEGTLAASQNSRNVVGTGTDFDADRDEDREIHIAGSRYRIATVTSETQIELTAEYSGADATGLGYALGVRYVGEPWEVRVPTSLVTVQSGPGLPDFG